MVGGSGLYVNSVLFDYDFRKPSTEETRDSFDKFTTEELQTMCSTIGIDVKSTNRRHLIRALETGQATELKEQQLRPDTLVIGIEAERQILQQRIVKRMGIMVKTGVMQEAEQLASKYGWDNEAMTGNVYEVIHQAQDQQWNQVKMIEEAIKRDLQLAKRQLTWFRRNPFIQWGEPGELITKVAQFVQKYKSK
jgi:tRNA dimethylallyltransferase